MSNDPGLVSFETRGRLAVGFALLSAVLLVNGVAAALGPGERTPKPSHLIASQAGERPTTGMMQACHAGIYQCQPAATGGS